MSDAADRLRALLTPPTDAERAEWGRLCEEATPGPWTTGGPHLIDIAAHDAYIGGTSMADARGRADARFVATARTALPRLLAALSAVEGERDEARLHRDQWRRYCEGARETVAMLTAALPTDEDLADDEDATVQAIRVEQERDTARAEVAELRATLDNERGRSEPPAPEWEWIRGQWETRADAFGTWECVVSCVGEVWRYEWVNHDEDDEDSDEWPDGSAQTAREAMRAALAALRGGAP